MFIEMVCFLLFIGGSEDGEMIGLVGFDFYFLIKVLIFF